MGRRDSPPGAVARRHRAGAQLPAARHPGRRRPRRRFAGAVADRRRRRPRTPSCSAACTSWPRPPKSSARTRPCSSRTSGPGCSLADSITPDELRAWKDEHPGAVVVSYVNTTAAVKALTDICCTSSNAVEVVESIDPDREVLFCPDQFLGAHVRRMTGRRQPARVGRRMPRARRDQRRRAHRAGPRQPRCRTVRAPRMRLCHFGVVPGRRGRLPGGPGEDLVHRRHARRRARRRSARKVLVATEVGMLHQLRRAAPEVDFRAVNDRASCKYMKMITPAALLRCLVEGADEVHVDPEIAAAGAPQCAADDRDRPAGRRRMMFRSRRGRTPPTSS